MNIGLILSKAVGMAKHAGGMVLLQGKKYAPELLIGGGVAGFILTIVETVKATNETNDILQKREENINECTIALAYDTEREKTGYTREAYENDLRKIKRQTRWELIKAWAPTGTTATLSILMIFGGYRIINGRYVATAAAYKTLEAFVERYRGNVVEEFGKDTDWRMAHSVKAEELEEARKEREEKLEEAKKNSHKKYRTAYQKDINNQIFDYHSDNWRHSWIPHQVLDYVQMKESQLQDKLNSRGYVFLNEAYEALGMPMTPQGALLGWINTPRNNHMEKGYRLSLGYANDECPEDELRRILGSPSNEETWLWITPNCDGVIYQMIDKPYSER